MTEFNAERHILMSTTPEGLNRVVFRIFTETEDEDSLRYLSELAKHQAERIEEYLDNPQLYQWRYLDADNEVFELYELKNNYEEMSEERGQQYGDFREYLSAQMTYNGGTLTTIL